MNTEERFWSKVAKTPTCWNWTAYRNAKGYGQFRFQDRAHYAHRVSYMLTRGPIPIGRQLDHLCRNPSCVRPEHLEIVTPLVNTLRGEPAQRTHCPHGHAYDEENTYWRGNKRFCRACHRYFVRAEKKLRRLGLPCRS